MIGKKGLKVVSLLFLIAFFIGTVISCSGGGGGGGTTISATSQAAASSSGAMGAVKLSSTVGASAEMASGSIPAEYAPGKMKVLDTSDIAKLDPRLKTVVDKMMSQLQKPIVTNTMSKTRASKTSSAPLSAATTTSGGCLLGGSYTITVDSITSLETTTNTLDITFTNCKDYDSATATHSNLYGSLTGTHAFNVSTGYGSANLGVNLTDTSYPTESYTAGSETNVYAMNGVFNSVDNNGASGTNSALGSFSWTLKDPVNGDTVMSFSFGSGAAPVTDVWTSSTDISNNKTDINTGNGAYTLGIAGPNGSLTYSVTLSGLEYKLLTYAGGGSDEWINGSVSIAWTPDLSQWGCLNGTYAFTTAVGTPVHTPLLSNCPTSGTVQVNNATIQYNTDQTVTVSVGTLTETFSDCDSLGGGGMCG